MMRRVGLTNNRITAALAILALFSVGSIALTAINCAQGMKAILSVQLELREQDRPHVRFVFIFILGGVGASGGTLLKVFFSGRV
jgi:hypothetical protein